VGGRNVVFEIKRVKQAVLVAAALSHHRAISLDLPDKSDNHDAVRFKSFSTE
jgi:hypothetical protein